MPKLKNRAILKVVYLPISKIQKYSGNAKLHSDKQVSQIVKSIRRFDFINPILIDEKSIIIAGHGRMEAAIGAGLDKVPVIQIKHLTEAEKKAYRIADNKLTELGEWDIGKLQLEFEAIESLDVELDFEITGFNSGELDVLMDNACPKADPQKNSIPFIPDDEIVSREGDIWELGKHRIICGNSLVRDTFSNLMKGEKARMVFSDPPYNLSTDEICGGGTIKHEDFKFAHGEMSSTEFQQFLKSSFMLLKEFSISGSLHYLCINWKKVKEMSYAGADVYDELKNICVWNKTNAGMGSLYRSKHEFIFVYKNGKDKHINNIELGVHGRYRTNVWDYEGINTFGKERHNLVMHPTVKPVELIKDAILDASNRGDIILDSFLGSGSTLIAAEMCKRVCYGIELEAKYIDTAIRRFETLTKQDAIHITSGKTYQELLKNKKEGK